MNERLYTAWWSARIGRAKARKESADLRDTLTLVGQSLSLIRDRAEEAEAERDQALTDLETAKGWRDEALDERDRQRREAAEYRRANTMLQEINTIRTAERDRLRTTIERVRAVHHLTEWVSLSDVCGRHHWFRTVEPNPENIAVADVCPDCQPRRYMNCVCADDECPVLAALDQVDGDSPADLVVVSRADLRRYFDSDQSDFAASVDGLKRLWTAAGIETP